MQWFGTNWGAAICKAAEQVEVPVGTACIFCKKVFIAESMGLVDGDRPAHVQCFLEACNPSLEYMELRTAAWNILSRAADLTRPDATNKLDQVRRSHVRAMREAKSSGISEARAVQIAAEGITEAKDGVIELHMEKLVGLLVQELDRKTAAS